ncbi:hypothetical protein [Desulfosarcina ovata]|uniref:PilZ domain-containing protein n=1 Tax=Desulfosarcina ovata subsp. ovata TaxID=2752305 RepID=A0A5K8ADJ0_9BACT|nr:hypothetical protein [Desulfosarcina ovata]BBO90558.1 hypothetical protein DSCOOX_37380 [Desulfosarcina ovata subsp. ovata]
MHRKRTEQKNDPRIIKRSPTEVAVICSPFTSSGMNSATDGVMYNFSTHGSYLEARKKFNTGTILIVRTVGHKKVSLSKEDANPRLIGLAEIKWLKRIDDKEKHRYGIGLQYIL